MRAPGEFSPQKMSCFQVASRWVRVSGPAAPGRLEGTRETRKEGAKSEIRNDPAVDSQHCLASPSTPSQHLLPVALFSPATSLVRGLVCLLWAFALQGRVWCRLAFVKEEKQLNLPYQQSSGLFYRIFAGVSSGRQATYC